MPAEASAAAPRVAAIVAAPSPAAEAEHVRAQFLKEHLAYDWKRRQVVEGTARRPLDREAFYRLVERPDLIVKTEAASRRRLYLAISGGVVAAAGITVGIAELASAPDVASTECQRDPVQYNEVCVPTAARHHLIGTLALVGGIGAGALLGTLAYWSAPDVLTPDQVQSLIAQHNAELMKRLRAKRSSLRLTPVIGPQGGGLVASVRF